MCHKCKAILLNNSVSADWSIAVEEWDLEPLHSENTCMCGKDSGNVVEFTNKLNGNKQIMGRICVKGDFLNERLTKKVKYIDCVECGIQIKYNYKGQHEITEKHRLNSENYHMPSCETCGIKSPNLTFAKCTKCIYIETHKTCITCLDVDIPITSEHDKCSKCIIKENYKKCDQCRKYTVPIDNEEDTCGECHKKELQMMYNIMWNRECIECHQLNIPKTKDAKYKKCFECYEYSSIPSLPCPDCGKGISKKQSENFKKCYGCSRKKPYYQKGFFINNYL